MSFFEELKRRNVFRVGIAYVLLGWVVLQAADFALDLIDAPNWTIQALFIAGLAGLPIALFFAWAFELTPEGIKREADVDRSGSVTPTTGRKLDRAIIAFLAIALVLVLGERFFLAGKPGDTLPQTEQTASGETVASAKSVAVLPFADMSQAGDQEWFADGLAEEILNSLVRVPDLQVAARTSSFQYKDTNLSIPDIAAELGVAHVLEGSVRSSDDRIRVTAQLIRADDGFHVWSENYDRDPQDMISIQEDLARNIATALQTTMDAEALAAMSQVGTRSVSAYQEHLKGLKERQESLSSADGGAQFLRAYGHFERARELDPGFSSAHVDAADFWKVQMTISRTDTGLTDSSPQEVLASYHERIDAASRSASSEIDRLRILADQAEVDLRLREALDLYQRYLAERPNDDNARFSAFFVAAMLSEDAAAKELLAPWRERAATDYAAAQGYINVAYSFVDPSEAADVGIEALRRWPNNDGLLYQTHRTLLWAGRRMEARALAERYVSLVPEPSPLLLAREACSAGDRDEAERILEELDPKRGNLISTTWLIADLLGDNELIRETLRPLEADRVPFRISSLLGYLQFDPRPFSSLMAVLEREGVDRPAPAQTPFACPPPEKTSIAVLAFENMSPDAANEYFADGISEEILNVLSSLEDLRVIARTSAFSFKGSGATVGEIAAKLDVGYVLEGSVRKAGDRVRITTQLIETRSESNLWSATYDRDLTDIFAVQDEIARAISDELKIQLTPSQEQILAVALTDNIEAYNLYLQGRQLWHRRGIENIEAAADALREAVSLDPQFAEAWAALADAWVLIPEYNLDGSLDAIPAARDAVNRALELKPNLAQALTTRAYLRFMHDHDWENAEKDFQRAMQLDPSYATAKQWYGEFLAARDNDVDGALALFREAAALDPLAPIMWHVSGWVSDTAGRYEEATSYYDKALQLNPQASNTLGNLYFMNLKRGEFEQAQLMLDRLNALGGNRFTLPITLLDGLSDPSQRQPFLELLINDKQIPEGMSGKAVIYMMLGEEELAMDSLEASLEIGNAYAVHIKRPVIFEPLWDTPRFKAHLAKLNLEP